MSFKKWLEDTGEVRTALLTNEPFGIPSKYTQSKKWDKKRIRNPFETKGEQKPSELLEK